MWVTEQWLRDHYNRGSLWLMLLLAALGLVAVGMGIGCVVFLIAVGATPFLHLAAWIT